MYYSHHLLATLTCTLGLSLSALHGQTIVNGTFETGNLNGWTSEGSPGVTASNVNPLAGAFSADFPSDPGAGTHYFSQTLSSPLTSPVTLSLLFSMADPGGDSDRGFNMILVDDNTPLGLVNMRVVDLGDDGDGDIQLFNGSSWDTISALQNSVSFGSTNTLEVSFNDFGASLDFDITVNAISATGLNTVQSNNLINFNEVRFANSSSVVGFKVDNVAVIPEPHTYALAMAAVVGGVMILRRRKHS